MAGSQFRLVDTGGKVLIGTSAGGSNLLDGYGIEDCSLSVRRTNSEFQPMELTSPNRRGIRTDYRITLNRGLEDDTVAGQTAQNMILNLALLSRVYVTYKDPNGVVTFAGWCVWEDIGDTQRTSDFGRQSVSLINDGDPDTPSA